jgi:hypothetical protein
VQVHTPGCIHIVLHNAGCQPPFLLQNRTRHELVFRQDGTQDAWRLLEPYSALGFSWPFLTSALPHGKEGILLQQRGLAVSVLLALCTSTQCACTLATQTRLPLQRHTVQATSAMRSRSLTLRPHAAAARRKVEVALRADRSTSVRVQLDDPAQHGMQGSAAVAEYTTLTARGEEGDDETFLLHVQDVVDGVLSGVGVCDVAGEGAPLLHRLSLLPFYRPFAEIAVGCCADTPS